VIASIPSLTPREAIASARALAAQERVLDCLYRATHDGATRPRVRLNSYREDYIATLQREGHDGTDEHYAWCRALVRAWLDAREFAVAMNAPLAVLDRIERGWHEDGNTGD
jgi:hypothetical protein